jgi:glutamate synthase (NADPH) small chain
VPPSPVAEDKPVIWPDWPRKERISSSQQEVDFTFGEKVQYTAETAWLEGDADGNVKKLHGHMVEWGNKGPKKVDGTEFTMDADLVLLAMGFVGPREDDVLADLGINTLIHRDSLGRIPEAPADYKVADTANVFTAGDMRRGQSLVVWAIREGRQCAHAVDEFLMSESVLPR